MKSQKHGTSTSVEVLNISVNGIWVYAKGKEYFLSYEDFPWFKDAKISDIQKVKMIHGRHLYWERLDVDLDVESMESPDHFPLKDRRSIIRTARDDIRTGRTKSLKEVFGR